MLPTSRPAGGHHVAGLLLISGKNRRERPCKLPRGLHTLRGPEGVLTDFPPRDFPEIFIDAWGTGGQLNRLQQSTWQDPAELPAARSSWTQKTRHMFTTDYSLFLFKGELAQEPAPVTSQIPPSADWNLDDSSGGDT